MSYRSLVHSKMMHSHHEVGYSMQSLKRHDDSLIIQCPIFFITKRFVVYVYINGAKLYISIRRILAHMRFK